MDATQRASVVHAGTGMSTLKWGWCGGEWVSCAGHLINIRKVHYWSLLKLQFITPKDIIVTKRNETTRTYNGSRAHSPLCFPSSVSVGIIPLLCLPRSTIRHTHWANKLRVAVDKLWLRQCRMGNGWAQNELSTPAMWEWVKEMLLRTYSSSAAASAVVVLSVILIYFRIVTFATAALDVVVVVVLIHICENISGTNVPWLTFFFFWLTFSSSPSPWSISHS